MARTADDLFTIRIRTTASVSLDWERIEQDPVFRTILAMYPEQDNPQGTRVIRREALRDYLAHYLMRERLLRDMPSTNGPGSLYIDELLDLETL